MNMVSEIGLHPKNIHLASAFMCLLFVQEQNYYTKIFMGGWGGGSAWHLHLPVSVVNTATGVPGGAKPPQWP